MVWQKGHLAPMASRNALVAFPLGSGTNGLKRGEAVTVQAKTCLSQTERPSDPYGHSDYHQWWNGNSLLSKQMLNDNTLRRQEQRREEQSRAEQKQNSSRVGGVVVIWRLWRCAAAVTWRVRHKESILQGARRTHTRATVIKSRW